MPESQNLIITSSGLSRVASELINQRIYDSSYISKHGRLIVDDEGMASLFGESSYASYSDINLSEARSVRIKFTGNFVPSNSNNYQCCWSLAVSSDISSTLSFYIKTDGFALYKGNAKLFDVSRMNIDIRDLVSFDVTLTEGSCNIIVETIKGAQTFVRDLHETLTLYLYNEINIGWSVFNVSAYWVDRISLKDFIIFKDGLMTYSPSQDVYFNLEKILISDGTFSLENNSYPILNHVYEIPVEDISRTGNVLLVRATVENDIYLKISEIGLYGLTEDKSSFLFCKAKGFVINKSSDLDYDLVLKVDLTTRVVNTIAFPEIKIKDLEYLTKQDINNVSMVYTNSVTDMERAITNNSEIIGRAGALSVNELITSSNECYKNSLAVQNYNTLRNFITSGTITDFYAFSTYPYSKYCSRNLSGLNNSEIHFLEGSITGEQDNIDFSLPNGFSLCVNLNLYNTENKILLTKIKSTMRSGQTYFSLELKDLGLIFKLFMKDNSVITLNKFFTLAELNDILRGNYLVTITCEKTSAGNPYLKMYGNSKLLATAEGSTNNFNTNLVQYYIANYLSGSSLAEKNYVNDIVSFNKTLSIGEIAFISTILGTND